MKTSMSVRASRFARGWLVVGLLVLTPMACGGSNIGGLGLDGPASVDAGGGGLLPSGDGAAGDGGNGNAPACSTIGAGCIDGTQCCVGVCTANACGGSATTDGGTKACNTDGACVTGFDCCSGTCANGACAVAAPPIGAGDAGAGVCLAPSASCTESPQCCSGLCEPVTGEAAVVQCRDACRADGVACTSAQDCCSLGCFGGVCTDALCATVGTTCAANADCCSGVCNARKQCGVDLPNSTCRPTGEDCGKGPQSGCCGATKDDDLCGSDGRCQLPPTACHGQKAACTTDGDCCSVHCDSASHTCTTLCTATAGACTGGSTCCSSSCTNGACDSAAPPTSPGGDAGAPICKGVGLGCASGVECCSTLCLAGFCDLAPR